MASCCGPGRGAGAPDGDVVAADGVMGVRSEAPAGPRAERGLPGGRFAMGDHHDEGYQQDGETPVHDVVLRPFSIDVHHVTNTGFARFVEATGYVTDSEKFGWSAVFHSAVRALESDILGRATGTPWWLVVRGATWARPAGPLSSWEDVPDHPVVQVSWNDAAAYCRWAGRRLPTEAEWEYAARGGLEGGRFPWGDELLDEAGTHRCNIWQGEFPGRNTLEDGFLTTNPVGTFGANGYGLHDMVGNAWEWCADWFSPRYYTHSPGQDPRGPAAGSVRVMRGGSYLCHDSYCYRYRVAARSSNTPDTATGNLGFRTVTS
ncbi:formylglycine-generating enzyme family protein [Georgenia yuyongxinii]|uniref:Formylglycine-generating enzyme family protein n=1 Tax=Georgenia yuyongxinii TaxID=2589797 RepID=A0A552WUS4_9MICO|nr:formylglycine-generating enzyme family protein [Georgenia yuyongxinii]